MESVEHTELIQTGTAARLLGISPTTVHWLERTGKLAALRVDRNVRLFRRSDVENLAREREARRAGAEAPEPAAV